MEAMELLDNLGKMEQMAKMAKMVKWESKVQLALTVRLDKMDKTGKVSSL